MIANGEAHTVLSETDILIDCMVYKIADSIACSDETHYSIHRSNLLAFDVQAFFGQGNYSCFILRINFKILQFEMNCDCFIICLITVTFSSDGYPLADSPPTSAIELYHLTVNK